VSKVVPITSGRGTKWST